MAKVLQLNLNHCSEAQDLLSQLVREKKVDVALISELYRDLREPNWVSDITGRAAIWMCGRLHIVSKRAIPSPDFTWVEVAGMRIYSCYFPSSALIEEFLRSLDALITSAQSSRLPLVIWGDFNAWATEWGSLRTNHRGRALLEALAILELVIANTGNNPIYAKEDKSSIVDLTFVDARLMGDCINWHVSDCYTGSDHHTVVYQLQLTGGGTGARVTEISRERWAAVTFNLGMFLGYVEGTSLEGTAEERSRDLSRIIQSACDASMSKKTNSRGRPPTYWWNEDIAEIRREYLRAIQLHQRAAREPQQEELRVSYAQKRKQLKVAIKAAKRRCLRKFCEEVDQDPWGRPYKTVMRRIKPGVTTAPTCPVLLDRIVRHLFPQHRRRTASTGLLAADEAEKEEPPDISEEELEMAARRIEARKAPGVDGVPGIAIKTAALNVPELFRSVYNACLREGTYPAQWKVQRLVLLP